MVTMPAGLVNTNRKLYFLSGNNRQQENPAVKDASATIRRFQAIDAVNDSPQGWDKIKAVDGCPLPAKPAA